MRKRLGFLACAIVALAGCGDDDGSVTPDPDGGPPPPALTGNWSCVGERTAPAPGEASTFTAHIYNFQGGTGTNVGGVAVDYFPDNVIADDCSAPCVRTTPGDDGNVAGLMGMQDAWFAYRVAAGAGTGGNTPVLTVGYNRAVPANGGVAQLPSVSNQTVGFIPMLYGRTRLPGTGIISGTLSDCDGQPAANAQVRIFRGGSELVPGAGAMDFFTGYFSTANLPDANRTSTNTNGLFAAANADITSEPVRVELWGSRTEGAAPERIACEEMQIFADGVAIVNVGPLRNDYEAGSGCN